MNSQAIKADLLMLIAAVIWGFAFVAQREGMETMGPFLFNGVRFLIGVIVLTPVVWFLSKKPQPEHKAKHQNTVATIEIGRASCRERV